MTELDIDLLEIIVFDVLQIAGAGEALPKLEMHQPTRVPGLDQGSTARSLTKTNTLVASNT